MNIVLFLVFILGVVAILISLAVEGVVTLANCCTPELRTNILTEQCILARGEERIGRPWYYKKGCSLRNREEKIQLIKESENFDQVRSQCSISYSGFNRESLTWDELRCEDLVK